MVGFEPTERVTAQTISSRSRYDHFDTSPNNLDIITQQKKKINRKQK